MQQERSARLAGRSWFITRMRVSFRYTLESKKASARSMAEAPLVVEVSTDRWPIRQTS
jgi:hypothetical protein